MKKLALMTVISFFAANKANAAYDFQDNLKTYIQLGGRYDSNVYRLADGVDNASTTAESTRSDTTLTPEVGAQLKLKLSRQELAFNASLFSPTHVNFTNLNYTGWLFSGAWNWMVGDAFSGNFKYSDGRSFYSFEDIPQTSASNPSIVADLLRTKTLSANANYLIGHNIQLSAGIDRRDSNHSTVSALDIAQLSRTVSIGLVSDQNSSARIYSSYTTYEYKNDLSPFVKASDRGLNARENGISANWVYSPKTQFNARWGQSSTHFDTGQSVPKTWVGNIGADLSVASQVKIKTNIGQTVDSGINGQGRNIVRSYSLRTDWLMSQKTNLYLSGLYSERDYGSDVQVNARRDKDASLELGANYHPLRNIDVNAYSIASKRGVKNASYPAGFEAFVLGLSTRIWF